MVGLLSILSVKPSPTSSPQSRACVSTIGRHLGPKHCPQQHERQQQVSLCMLVLVPTSLITQSTGLADAIAEVVELVAHDLLPLRQHRNLLHQRRQQRNPELLHKLGHSQA